MTTIKMAPQDDNPVMVGETFDRSWLALTILHWDGVERHFVRCFLTVEQATEIRDSLTQLIARHNPDAYALSEPVTGEPLVFDDLTGAQMTAVVNAWLQGRDTVELPVLYGASAVPHEGPRRVVKVEAA